MTPEQQRLFDMLVEVVDICEREGITYYAAGGTALGAVRHGGFIPWDDDVDLMMPRADWERFVEIARAGGLPEGRVLSCLELDIDYPHVFGRYTDTTSCAIHYNQMLGGTPEGFIIDIFVLDPVPDNREAFQKHRETLSLYNDLSNELGYSYPMSSDLNRLKQLAIRIRSEGRATVLGELATGLARYDEDDCDYLVMRWAAAPRLFRKELFACKRYESFEGLRLRVPGMCADYLVQHYGDDWMYVPPHAERAVHDAITFVDVDYRTVQDDYLPFLDVDRVRKAMLNRRSCHIRCGDDLRAADDLEARICASFARRVTVEQARACDVDLEELLARGEYAALDDVFSEFYRWQASPLLEGREEYLHIRRYYDPISADLNDELLGPALENLVHTNRMGVAWRILRVFEHVHGEPRGRTLRAKRLLEAMRLPASLQDAGCESEAYELSEWLLDQYPQNFSNRVFFLELLRRRGDWERLRSCAREGLSYFPDAGEFALYELEYDWVRSRGDDAKKRLLAKYEKALERTTHAGLSQDVQRKARKHPSLVSDKLQALLQESGSGANSVLGEVHVPLRAQAVPGRAVNKDKRQLGLVALRLLGEAVCACREAGIDCWVGPVTCRLSLGQEDEVAEQVALPPVLDLLIPAGCMGEALEALESAAAARPGADRAIDCWKTNGSYLSFQIDYVDKTSTLLQLGEGTNYRAHGARVTLVPVRSCLADGKCAARLALLEEGWEANGYRLTKNLTPMRLAAAALARMHMVRGRHRFAGKLFDEMSACFRTTEHYEGSVILRHAEGPAVAVDSRYFLGTETIYLAGTALPAPVNANGLLDELTISGWPGLADVSAALGRDVLATSLIPYEHLFSTLRAEGCDPNLLFRLMRRVRMRMAPMANDLRIRNRAMRVAARSEDRKRLYDNLHSCDGEIAQLLDEGDFTRLGILLADYEHAALGYLKQGLGLCPCRFHLDALCAVLRYEGKTDEADKLARISPPEHYQPL